MYPLFFSVNTTTSIIAGTSTITTTELAAQLDNWVYKTATLKNNIMKFYVNGKLSGNSATVPQSSLDIFRFTKNLYTRIGSSPWMYESQDYAGVFLLDDFAVSDKVIFDGEFSPPSGYLVDSYNTYKDKDSYLYGYK